MKWRYLLVALALAVTSGAFGATLANHLIEPEIVEVEVEVEVPAVEDCDTLTQLARIIDLRGQFEATGVQPAQGVTADEMRDAIQQLVQLQLNRDILFFNRLSQLVIQLGEPCDLAPSEDVEAAKWVLGLQFMRDKPGSPKPVGR